MLLLVIAILVTTTFIGLNPREIDRRTLDTAVITSSSTTVGISDNDLYFYDTVPATITKHINAIQTLEVKNIRIAIPWAAVETSQGQYSWTGIDNMVDAAYSAGLGVLGVVNTTPAWARAADTSVYNPPTSSATFGDFMGVLAQRYGSKVSAFEVWNEPNAALGYQPSPDPLGYTALLKAAYPAIKAVNSSAIVIGGVLGSTITFGSLALNPVDFVKQMYAAGAAGYFDALSFHPYQNTTKFSEGASLTNSPLNQVNAIRALMVTNGDTAKKVWATEYGLATGTVGLQNQADFIADFLDAWHSLAFAGPAFIYTLVDRNSADTSDAENTFGIYTDTWSQKPSAAVISTFNEANP